MSTRPVGFSTGTLNPRKPHRAIETSLALGADAIELSALRPSELHIVAEAARSPALSAFRWVSVHAPSTFEPSEEASIARAMIRMSRGAFAVIVHPDTISDPSAWRPLGDRLLLENMDRRKARGRFANEFHEIFSSLPEARLCLDLAHARQIDPSLVEAFRFLREFGDRLVELHVSEVDARSRHAPLSMHAESHLKDFARLIPSETPVIIESVLDRTSASDELRAVRDLLGVASPSAVS